MTNLKAGEVKVRFGYKAVAMAGVESIDAYTAKDAPLDAHTKCIIEIGP